MQTAVNVAFIIVFAVLCFVLACVSAEEDDDAE
jgi:hypothetical protein